MTAVSDTEKAAALEHIQASLNLNASLPPVPL